VQAGQQLATIETPDLDQQLEQAKAQLVLRRPTCSLAEVTDNRWKELLKTASVRSKQRRKRRARTAAASVEADRANSADYRTLVSFQRVVAPFAGTITIARWTSVISSWRGAEAGNCSIWRSRQTPCVRSRPQTGALGIAPGQAATLTS